MKFNNKRLLIFCSLFLFLVAKSNPQVKKLFNKNGFGNIVLGRSIDEIKKDFVHFEQSSLKDTFHVTSIRSSWYVYSGDLEKYNEGVNFRVKYIFVCVADDNTINRIKAYIDDTSDAVYSHCETLLGKPSYTGKSCAEQVEWNVHHFWNLSDNSITLYYFRSFMWELGPDIEVTYSYLKDANVAGKFVVRKKFR